MNDNFEKEEMNEDEIFKLYFAETPKMYKDAIQNNEREEWLKAIKDELESLNKIQ